MPNLLRKIRLALHGWLRRGEHEIEMKEELKAHLECSIQANIDSGLSPREARRAALQQFGSTESIKETCREQRRVRWLEHFCQDLRYGARQLRKSPGFTTVAILTLALGIGANTAIFSVVNSMLLRPLPFRQPDDLVWIANGPSSDGGLSSLTSRVNNFLDWRRESHSFDGMTAYFAFFDYHKYTLTTDDEPSTLECVGVAENFIDSLGVRLALGRNFVHEECVWNGRKAVILTDRYWRAHFHGDRSIVGRTVTLDNQATEIVGVLPESFDFSSVFTPGSRADMLVPFPLCDETERWGNTLAVIGRLKPGVTLAAAQNELNVLNASLQRDHRERGNFGAICSPLGEQVRGSFRRSFVVLFCAVGSVLLIACINVSNLLLARASVRRKEVALRLALGAGRSRIIGQMLTESVLLSLIGAAAGLPLAYLATHFLADSHTFNIPLLTSVTVDGRALAFTVVASILVGVACGLIPALQLFNPDVNDDLKDSTRGSSRGRKRVWAREALVLLEVASSFVLLVGAGLLLHSFVRLLEVDPGFRADHAVAWPIHPSRDFTNNAEQAVYYAQMIQKIEAIPGVESAGFSDTLPLGRNRSWGAILKGQKYETGDDAFPRIVDAGYIHTMGIPLIAGRTFDPHDDERSQGVVVVSRSLARRLLPGKDIVGETLSLGGDSYWQIIGVVGDVRHGSLEAEGAPEMYFLGTQNGWSSEDLVVRTRGSMSALIPAVRATLHQIDPAMPIDEFKSLGDIVDQAISPKRFIAGLVGLFSLVALGLASIGIYGVVAYSVSQRTPELGIRLALGATTRDIVNLVLHQGMRPVYLGLGIGLLGALVLAQTLQSMLYGVSANDPITLIINAVLLAGVGLGACWLPARRAGKVDPMIALRAE